MQKTNKQFTLSRFLDKYIFIFSFLFENNKIFLLEVLSFKNQTDSTSKNRSILLKVWLTVFIEISFNVFFLSENVKGTYCYLGKVNQYKIIFLFINTAQWTNEKL